MDDFRNNEQSLERPLLSQWEIHEKRRIINISYKASFLRYQHADRKLEVHLEVSQTYGKISIGYVY